MTSPNKIIIPKISHYLVANTWISFPGKLIQCLDENNKPIRKGTTVQLMTIPEKRLLFRFGSSSSASYFPRYRTDDQGCIPMPDLFAEQVGSFQLLVKVYTAEEKITIQAVGLMPPQLFLETSKKMIGEGIPNATIQLTNSADQVLLVTKVNDKGRFYLEEESSTYGNNIFIEQNSEGKSSGKINLKELIKIPNVTEIRRTTENGIESLVGNKRLKGDLVKTKEGDWNQRRGQYQGGFNQVFIEVGTYEDEPPLSLEWSENAFNTLTHESGAILLPLVETQNEFWSVKLPQTFVSSKKIYVRQAVNRYSPSGSVLFVSEAEALGRFRIISQPQHASVTEGKLWALRVMAEEYQSLQWEFLLKRKWVDWKIDSHKGSKVSIGRVAEAHDETMYRVRFKLADGSVQYSRPVRLVVLPKNMKDMGLNKLVQLTAAGMLKPKVIKFDDLWSIAELQDYLKKEKISYETLINHCLAKIEKDNVKGKALHAVIQVNPNALTIAKERDAQALIGESKGLLHGIPILVKDTIDTIDMKTSTGNFALAEDMITTDAPVIEQLKKAGAIILGKTNLTELSGFLGGVPDGFSSVGGQTKNPYDIDMTVSGSSSGSAVAVAANWCPVALGVETSGSIISPASFNGVVGFRPSFGLISNERTVSAHTEIDVVGPIATQVKDAALLMDVLLKPTTIRNNVTGFKTFGEIKIPTSFVELLAKQTPKGCRIGKFYFSKDGRGDDMSLLESALPLYQPILESIYQEIGVEIVDMNVDGSDLVSDVDLRIILKGRFKTDLEDYLATRPTTKIKTLNDLIACNQKQKNHPPQPILEDFSVLDDQFQSEYQSILAKKSSLEKRFNQLIQDHHIHLFFGSIPILGAWLGCPVITIPLAVDKDTYLPVPLSFMGPKASDGQLLVLAYAIEQALKKRGLGHQSPTYQGFATENGSSKKK
jgi:amidase